MVYRPSSHISVIKVSVFVVFVLFLFSGTLWSLGLTDRNINCPKGQFFPQMDDFIETPLNTYQFRFAIRLNLENRQIKAKVIETNNGVITRLNGENKPIVLNFAELNNQIGRISNKSIKSIEIQNAPGTVIENQTFDGVSIVIFNSPSSIVRNNTIRNIDDTPSCGFFSCIHLSNSSSSIIEKNLISNISSFVPSATIYGIFAERSNYSKIHSNTIQCIAISSSTEADTLWFSSSIYGIYTKMNYELIIRNNMIRNLTVRNEAPYSSSNTYGIYLENCHRSNVSFNNLSRFNAFTEPNSDETNAGAESNSTGIFMKDSSNVPVCNNTVDNLSTNASANPDSDVCAFTFGIVVINSIESPVTFNTIRNLSATASTNPDDDPCVDIIPIIAEIAYDNNIQVLSSSSTSTTTITSSASSTSSWTIVNCLLSLGVFLGYQWHKKRFSS